MTLLRTLTLAVAILAPTAAGAEPIGASVMLVRDTAGLGQTKPPRRPDDVTFRGAAAGRAKNDAVGDRLSRGICIGCNAR